MNDILDKLLPVNEEYLFLKNIISVVNSDVVSFSLTINTGKFFICGVLVSYQTYLEALDDECDSRPYSADTNFLHLRDVKFYDLQGESLSSSSVILSGVWWRERLSENHRYELGPLKKDVFKPS
ncbi:MAG: hypothetical protein HRT88_18720 [Lentisphaeraceae bacterium]|nr:hypothetical protein [Lentisphaeraceae bacterium]